MNYNTDNPLILSIDGNIGSGKSTLLKYLKMNFENYVESKKVKKHEYIQGNLKKIAEQTDYSTCNNNSNDSNNKKLNICFLQEPVDKWEKIIDSTGKNIIENYYENNSKYSFVFQMNAYISRLSQLRNAINEKKYDIIITERSIYTDKNVFAKMLYDAQKINQIEFQVYMKWFDEFATEYKNLNIIYIQTNPLTCHERIMKRARKGEDVPIKYLIDCNLYHELWINSFNNSNLITFDGNVNINESSGICESNGTYYDFMMDKIYNFITSKLI